ncbi:MAG: phosphatidylserine decarboxylase family protein [Candidatus Omnitrophica bacterium CG11_big_fil_rev_8_21_14_0_20_45_26]|uniref:Phosphatidylserine decarboxylase family protein n=1 Tax=Candidatus Abzuiibacterium crystallinum TaxID=1974748 RepID=A0A2H0LRA2_9BACT|nr:MAG: phosphatidylserine decarboxylase family protein [Candidatus Omnitrophica bacterium CG11_big_fil_rev_8_21_14_0_20_45_26]PIW65550.1 MAG: phosphatidylserine decarboxylase family protein [Candidatus Omnitrophica bacterium CG12_big_fil_rev_8_21_14_0_65_45_16]
MKFKLPIDQRAWPGSAILLALSFLLYFICHLPGWALVVFILWMGHLVFFRDLPCRPQETNVIYSPACGTVVDIETVAEDQFLKTACIKIGIFLSIFDGHVTLAPLTGEIDHIQYVPGKFLNALKQDSALKNEANWIVLKKEGKKVVVKQITGAIARRIYCDVKVGEKVAVGRKMGIICYGSRVEVYIPEGMSRLQVRKGDYVRAGQSILGAWINE